MTMADLEGLWPTVLLECQEEVQKYVWDRYKKEYRPQELFYWTYVPRWMAEDWGRRKPARVLDIGCAYGVLLLYAHRLTVCEAFAIDFVKTYASPELFRKWQMRFALCNIELDPLPWPGPFDSIIFTETIEHLNFRPLPTLVKIRKMLSKGGTLYLSTPDGDFCGRVTKLYKSLESMPAASRDAYLFDDHTWQYSEAEIRELFLQAGLRITRLERSPGTYNKHINLTAEPAE